MSDCKIEPAPGQVWRHPMSDSDDAVLTLRSNDVWWASYRPAIKNHDGLVRPSDRIFLRWATPAECRAAGLDPEVVLPKPYQPKVGDVCVVLVDRACDSHLRRGDVVAVVGEIGIDSLWVQTTRKGDGNKWLVGPDKIRPATAQERAAAGLPPERPEYVRVLRYCAKGLNPVRRVLEWSETGLPVVESACDGHDGRWELVIYDQWEPAPPPAGEAHAALRDACRDAECELSAQPAQGGDQAMLEALFSGAPDIRDVSEPAQDGVPCVCGSADRTGNDAAHASGCHFKPGAQPAQAPEAVGDRNAVEHAIRCAYSVGYSAGCAGAPNSVRVSDLGALIAEHANRRPA